jgi:hypothetical protein
MTVVRAMLAILSTICVAACASFTYESTSAGKLRGQLLVVWVGEDRFVYWPYTNDPLTFTLAPDLQQKLGIQTIRPGLMYTDGGSIPRPLRAFDGFSPWGYAPAYILHDWVFAAHYCIVQGKPDPSDIVEYEKIKRFAFEDSAALLAEVMKTLMVNDRVRTNAEAFNLISFGVDSVVARNLWDKTATNSCDPVTPADKQLIKDALGRKTLHGFVPGMRSSQKPPLIVHSQTF